MAKTKRQATGPLQRWTDTQATLALQSSLDVLTPEQAASGDYADTGRRKFRLHTIDRLKTNGKLSYEQHAAGVWYRDQWDAGRYDNPQTSDPGRTRGANVLSFIPANQQRARDNFREARTKIPIHVLGLTEGAVLHNHWPRIGQQRQRLSILKDLKNGLDSLVEFLRL